jgi:hypothetical protein
MTSTTAFAVDELPDTQHDALQAALPPEVRERLSHLFRGTLKEGCIHPLYLPMLRYRSARSAA